MGTEVARVVCLVRAALVDRPERGYVRPFLLSQGHRYRSDVLPEYRELPHPQTCAQATASGTEVPVRYRIDIPCRLEYSACVQLWDFAMQSTI